jgi:hypothetical protein
MEWLNDAGHEDSIAIKLHSRVKEPQSDGANELVVEWVCTCKPRIEYRTWIGISEHPFICPFRHRPMFDLDLLMPFSVPTSLVLHQGATARKGLAQ